MKSSVQRRSEVETEVEVDVEDEAGVGVGVEVEVEAGIEAGVESESESRTQCRNRRAERRVGDPRPESRAKGRTRMSTIFVAENAHVTESEKGCLEAAIAFPKAVEDPKPNSSPTHRPTTRYWAYAPRL